ncbi:MAG: hypothetical protein HC802_12165 [Caldilineaceae bacterium]|nr:hypothetical protein [Caldilineaceae bacterium]
MAFNGNREPQREGATAEPLPILDPPPLPELTIQYADFARWQRQQFRNQDIQPEFSYWEQKLAGAPPLLDLPTDRPRPSIQRFRGGRHYFSLSHALTQGLQTLGRQEGATLFMTLLAAFDTLLWRYSGQEDVVIGTPYANRDEAEVQGLVGMFINTLVLRTDLSGNPPFRELLRRVRGTATELFSHASLPFEKLVEHLQPSRDLSYNPIFQVMFTLESEAPQAIELPGLTVSSFPLDSGMSKFDLTLDMVNGREGLGGWLDYNADLFNAATIARMAGHVRNPARRDRRRAGQRDRGAASPHRC